MSADLNKIRAVFMQRVSAPSILPLALKLAYLIAFKYMNRDSGVAFVGQETLARDLGVSTRHVRRLADMLQPLGLVIVLGHGPNQASTYWIDPDKATREQKRTRESGIKRTRGIEKRTPRARKADSTRHEKRTPESALPYKEKQRREPREESDSPAVALRDENKGTPDERNLFGKTESGPQAPRKTQGDRRSAADDGEAFDRFWAAYPRRVAKEAARKAYGKAIERGATDAALLAGAQRYAAERKDQDPKYTKHPATWLNGGCWEDELTGGAVIDQDGNVLAVQHPPPQQPRRTGFTAIADEMIEESERGIAAGTHDARGWPIWTR